MVKTPFKMSIIKPESSFQFPSRSGGPKHMTFSADLGDRDLKD